jgi:uncharacterized cofD-like protein
VKVVAIGGGHGTAVTLRALRLLDCDITAIVSVADDGGSTGVLRNELHIAGVGDIRKCLLALATQTKPWKDFFEFRFAGSAAGTHALGNLFLAAALERSETIEEAVAVVANLLDACGVVLPASQTGVELEAETFDRTVRGQAEIAKSAGIQKVRTIPTSVSATESGLHAIDQADLVVLGPGSLFTSVLAACVVPGITEALSRTNAQRVWIANLEGLDPETRGLGLIAQYAALLNHGLRIDKAIVHNSDEQEECSLAVEVVRADLIGSNTKVHDPAKLARVLQQIMAN